MKFASICAAIALALPAVTVAHANPGTHAPAWHPNGKTPSAIPQARNQRNCISAADHHRGSKGPLTPVVRCTSGEVAQIKAQPQAVDRGERDGGPGRLAPALPVLAE